MTKIMQSIEEMKVAFESLRAEKETWVYASAAITLDGKIESDRKPLGGPTDQEWYRYMAGEADEIIVGATTFRQSGISSNTKYQGRSITVLSQSLNLPLGAPAIIGNESFSVYTKKDAESSAVEAAGPNNRVLPFSSAEKIVAERSGAALVDGGGQIYSTFAPLVEDWFLTIVPRFGPSSKPSIWRENFDGPELRPIWLLAADDRLLCRFQRNDLSIKS